MKRDKPIIFALSGLPASGKSTLSKVVAKKYNAIYLRVDTIEQGLKDLFNITVQAEGYNLAFKIAIDNLKLGLNIIADSCNPIDITRKEWEKIAQSNNSDIINIEVICSDKKEHKKRSELRLSEIENLKSPSWEDIISREYHKWEQEIIVIDTAHKTVEESECELIQKIENILNKQTTNR